MELYKNTADNFIKYLKQHGYPNDSVAVEWGTKQCAIDIAILAEDKATPIAIYEIKGEKNQQSIKRGIEQLVRACQLLKITVPCSLVFRIDAPPFFEVIEVSDIVYNRTELDLGEIMKSHPAMEPISYKNLQSGIGAKVILEKQDAKQKRVDKLKPVCWALIPFCAIAILLLDAFNIYKLSAERLAVMGSLVIIVLIPFFSEVSVKDFTLKRNYKNDAK